MDKTALHTKLQVLQSSIDWTLWLCVVLLIYGLVEGAWGVLQLCDVVDSGHPRYPVTGSFYNPGPYGCFIGCLLPLAVSLYIDKHDNKFIKILAGAYILICALLLPGGMSRTGWIAAAMGIAIVFVGTNINKLRQLNKLRKTIMIIMVLSTVIIGGIGAYVLKPDSADGRLLMWKIAANATTYSPLLGVGWENVAGTYGDAQEAYFSSGIATAHEEMLAGTPAYVFNEYLQIAIAYGIPTAILFAIALVSTAIIYWRHQRYGLSGLTVAIMAVAFASYPLQFGEFKILIGIVVTMAFLMIDNKLLRTLLSILWLILWLCFSIAAQPIDISANFGHAQRAQRIGRYEASNQMLSEILPKTSDPMPLNIMGRNYQAMGVRDSAENCFLRAAVRVPNRLYPHYLLMKLYAESPSDSIKMKQQAEIILTKQPKKYSTAIEEMRQEARKLLTKP
ncbi:MAG: O-antigen ligase family protein [Muribaculum sp.]|nr:O-antigen ligase family protein [Muribaculum sp.]